MKFISPILGYATPQRHRNSREAAIVTVFFVVFLVTIIMCGVWIALDINQLSDFRLLSLECATLLVASTIAIGAAWIVARL